MPTSSPALPACMASRTSELMPSRDTYSTSRSSEPVKSSALTYSCGRSSRAASIMAAATCRGVPCALSTRSAWNSSASRRTYVVMCAHSQGESAGVSP